MNHKDMLIDSCTWDEVVDFQRDKGISIRQICRILQCDRSWVNRFIQPFCHYIYLNRLYAHALNVRDSVWLDKNEVFDLIKSNITCSRQTIHIAIELLIEPDKLDEFRRKLKDIDNKIDDVKNDFSRWVLRDQLYQLRRDTIKEYLSERGKRTFWNDEDETPYKHRSKYKWVSMPSYEPNLHEWQSVASMKKYGDYSEEIYRSLFLSGAIRCELNLCDINGNVSQKVYYIKNPKYDVTVRQVYVPYERFVKEFPQEEPEQKK